MAKAPAKKAAAKKPAAKKTAAKKAVAKKAPAKKASAKKSTAAASKTPTTVTLRQMSANIADKHGLTKKQTQEVFDDFVTDLTKHLKKGERVRMSGIGTLELRKRPARKGRNPATGEAIKIKASKSVGLRVSKELKDKL